MSTLQLKGLTQRKIGPRAEYKSVVQKVSTPRSLGFKLASQKRISKQKQTKELRQIVYIILLPKTESVKSETLVHRTLSHTPKIVYILILYTVDDIVFLVLSFLLSYQNIPKVT